MAHAQSLVANPFALMMEPEEVLKAVEGSELLGALTRHVCRPLDKPIIGKNEDGTPATSAGADVDWHAY